MPATAPTFAPHPSGRRGAKPVAIVPGHDPLVMRRYPPPKLELEGLVGRLDVMPRE
jgi:hypothetical protein